MRFYNIQNKFILLVILMMSAYSSICQLNTLSPYSRFGIGDLEGGTSVYSNNLGGATVALTPYVTLNYDNPASYPYLVSSIFQTSLNYNYTEIKNAESLGNVSRSTLKEIVIGAPFSENWGFSAGVIPYSTIGYEFSEITTDLPDNATGILEYQGNGGFSKGFLGFARKSTKNGYWVTDRGPEIGLDSIKYLKSALSVGLNIYSLFGTAEYERNLFFNDFSDYYHRLESSSTALSKGGTTLGFIYKKGLTPTFEMSGNDVRKTKQVNLQLGGTFDTFFGKVDTDNTTAIFNAFTQSSTLATIVADTIEFSEKVEGELDLPFTLTLGAAVNILNANKNLFEFSFQYKTQDWSDFTNSLSRATPDLYGASRNFSFGFQVTPKPINDDKANFLQRSLYQVGVTHNQTYLNLEGEAISENRLGLGCSIPFLKSKTLSRVNLGMDFGLRGTTDNGLIEESSFNAYVGFSLTPNLRLDKWFKQSKYQ